MSYRLLLLALIVVGATAVAIRPKQNHPIEAPIEARIEAPIESATVPEAAPQAPLPALPTREPQAQKSTPTQTPAPKTNSRYDNTSEIVSQEAKRVHAMYEAVLRAMPGNLEVKKKEEYPSGAGEIEMVAPDGSTVNEYYNKGVMTASDLKLKDGTTAGIYYDSTGGVRSYTISRGKRMYQVKYFKNGEIESLYMPTGKGNQHLRREWSEKAELTAWSLSGDP